MPRFSHERLKSMRHLGQKPVGTPCPHLGTSKHWPRCFVGQPHGVPCALSGSPTSLCKKQEAWQGHACSDSQAGGISSVTTQSHTGGHGDLSGWCKGAAGLQETAWVRLRAICTRGTEIACRACGSRSYLYAPCRHKMCGRRHVCSAGGTACTTLYRYRRHSRAPDAANHFMSCSSPQLVLSIVMLILIYCV
jgi:hypothetical protein